MENVSGSLKHKTVKGVGWSFADNIAGSGVTFLVGLVLARLLSPGEFGIIGMITVFIAIANTFVDSGFSNALIRKQDASRVDYNTTFLFNLAVSLCCYGILYALAPAIGNFFDEPRLVSITRVVGIVLVINALSIVQRTRLVKDVDFKTQTKISVIASVGSGIVGIGMALLDYGVWSLVGQQVSRQFLNTILLWYFSAWHPRFEFSSSSFRELFGFGFKLLLSGLLDTVWRNIYYVVIGRFYSAVQLGQYTRAEQFNTIFSSNLTGVVQRVSYPVLSSIQDDQERLKAAYRKVIKITMLVTFACMLGLAAVAKSLVLVLIGERWLVSVGYLQIICFSGMLYPLHAINLNILQVKGRSDLFLKLEVIKKCIAVIPIVLGIWCGIEFMLVGSVFTSIIAYFLNSHYSSELIHYPTWRQAMDILPTLVISLLVAGCMWSVTLLSLSSWVTLCVQCVVGISLALFIYERSGLEEYVEIRQLALSIIKRK